MRQTKLSSTHWLLGAIFAASLASLGTIPYGFQFARTLVTYNVYLSIVMGIIFAGASAFANIALGVYSFLRIRDKQKVIVQNYLMLISLISAIPIGCMCYFAYYPILPIYLTLIITCAVTIINAIIAYTAIFNLVLEIKNLPLLALSHAELVFRAVGFIIGIFVSLTAYMAAIHGINEILSTLVDWDIQLIFRVACFIGLITWLPFAALFSNATQASAGHIYFFLGNLTVQIKQLDLTQLGIFCLSFCSGTAFAQITLVFFNPEMNIPALAKTIYMQNLIHHYLVPFAFLSSVAVNYLALKNLFNQIEPSATRG